MVRQNTRQPIETEGDVYSLAACNDIGCCRLVEMMDEFGLESFDGLADYVCQNSYDAVMAEVEAAERNLSSSMTIDGYDKPLELVAQVTISDDGIAGHDGTRNRAMGLTCLTLIPSLTPLVWLCLSRRTQQCGSLAPFKVRAPEGRS